MVKLMAAALFHVNPWSPVYAKSGIAAILLFPPKTAFRIGFLVSGSSSKNRPQKRSLDRSNHLRLLAGVEGWQKISQKEARTAIFRGWVASPFRVSPPAGHWPGAGVDFKDWRCPRSRSTAAAAFRAVNSG